jgi:hypothetical protein
LGISIIIRISVPLIPTYNSKLKSNLYSTFLFDENF